MINNIIYATRINSGGGLVYLSFLHKKLDKTNNLILLDYRIKNNLRRFKNARVIYLKKNILIDIKTFLIRLNTYLNFQYKKYFYIKKNIKFSELYLNGMPPLVRFPFTKNSIEILCQNRFLFSSEIDDNFNIKEKLMHFLAKRLFFTLLIHKTDKLIAQTNKMKRVIQKKYKSNQIIVSDKDWKELTKSNYYYGMKPYQESIFFESLLKKINKISLESIIFFYPAHFHPHKNHHNLIKGFLEAAASLKKPIKLLLTINENTIPSYFKDQKIIVFTGEIAYLEIKELYKLVDFLIFPSILESLGLPLLEAKLNNIPIICSECEYVYEVCKPEKTFDPYSYKDISQSIVDLIERSDTK